MTHLRELEKYLVSHPFQPEMSVMDKIKFWLQQGGEVLSAEAIARALPDTNNKIMFSLHKFMVRAMRSFSNRPPRLPSSTQLGGQIQVERDLTAMQRSISAAHADQVRSPSFKCDGLVAHILTPNILSQTKGNENIEAKIEAVHHDQVG
jgi:hypothetical protein